MKKNFWDVCTLLILAFVSELDALPRQCQRAVARVMSAVLRKPHLFTACVKEASVNRKISANGRLFLLNSMNPEHVQHVEQASCNFDKTQAGQLDLRMSPTYRQECTCSLDPVGNMYQDLDEYTFRYTQRQSTQRDFERVVKLWASQEASHVRSHVMIYHSLGVLQSILLRTALHRHNSPVQGTFQLRDAGMNQHLMIITDPADLMLRQGFNKHWVVIAEPRFDHTEQNRAAFLAAALTVLGLSHSDGGRLSHFFKNALLEQNEQETLKERVFDVLRSLAYTLNIWSDVPLFHSFLVNNLKQMRKSFDAYGYGKYWHLYEKELASLCMATMPAMLRLAIPQELVSRLLYVSEPYGAPVTDQSVLEIVKTERSPHKLYSAQVRLMLNPALLQKIEMTALVYGEKEKLQVLLVRLNEIAHELNKLGK